jgi:Tol biopolymer transport system component
VTARVVVGIVAAALASATPAAGVEGHDLFVPLNDGSIAFVSPAGVRTGILAGRPVEGTNGPAEPVWSPDGTRVAFARDGIVVADLDGRQHRLTSVPVSTGGVDARPSWSSDGTLIAFRRYINASEAVAVVSASGGPVRLLASGGTYADPSWQPGTRTLLFRRTDLEGGLHTVDAEGTPGRRIADRANAALWSPDGAAIAVARETGLELIAPDGSGARMLVPDGVVGDLAWSPDGRRIAFVVWTSRRFSPKLGFTAQPDVFIVDRDGANLARLTGLEGDQPFERPEVRAARWWPGGSRLFFRRGKDTWTMNADGSCEQRLPSTLSMIDVPTWSPLASAVPAVECSAAQIRLRAGGEEIGAAARCRFRSSCATTERGASSARGSC